MVIVFEGVRRQEFIFVNSGLNHSFHPTGKYEMYYTECNVYSDYLGSLFDAFSFDEHLAQQEAPNRAVVNDSLFYPALENY